MVAQVADFTVAEAASVTSLVATVPSTTVAGDLLLAHATGNVQTPPTGPTGWTLIRSQAGDSSAANNGSALFSRAAIAGDAGTSATFTGASATAGRMSVIMLRVNGHNSTTPLDATATSGTGPNSTTTYDAPGVTTGSVNSLALWFVTKNSSSSTATINATNATPTKVAATSSPTLLGRAQAAFSEVIVAAGATGVRNFTSTATSQWTDITTAVRSVSATAPNKVLVGTTWTAETPRVLNAAGTWVPDVNRPV